MSLARIRTVLSWCLPLHRDILICILLVAILGEVYMRAPFILQRLEYGPDRELDGRLMPNQRGFEWLANISLKSPPITVNSDGHRGHETDWSKPILAVLGDSDSFGYGVEDDDTWTAVLERHLRRRQHLASVQVVNASHPGDGPGQHSVVLARLLAKGQIRAAIARVSIQDRNFVLPREADKDALLRRAQMRARLRRFTKFLPYAFAKLAAQESGFRNGLVPAWLKTPEAQDTPTRAAVGIAMWEANKQYFDAIISSAGAHQIPLIFILYDPEATESGNILWDLLSQLAAAQTGVIVMHIGPRQLGLDSAMGPELHNVLRDTLTLRRDAHANSLQHHLIGDSVYDFLSRETTVLDSLRE